MGEGFVITANEQGFAMAGYSCTSAQLLTKV